MKSLTTPEQHPWKVAKVAELTRIHMDAGMPEAMAREKAWEFASKMDDAVAKIVRENA
jgi:hypothetical protein